MNNLDLYAYEAMDRLHIIEVMIQESIVNHKYFDELASDEFRTNVDAAMMSLADAYKMAGADYDEGIEDVVLMQQIPNPPSIYYEVITEIKAELEDKYRLHNIEEIYSSYEGRITHAWFLDADKSERGFIKVAFLNTWYDKHDKQWNCTWKVLGDIDESNL